MVRLASAFALIAALLLVVPARGAQPQPQPAQTWLVLSDIHFDPFTQPKLVERLEAAPPERWRAIFESGETVAPSGAGSDTNDALLESTLEGARNAVDDPRVVIVSGDFLAHGFRAKFDRESVAHDDVAYDSFVDKTIAFLAWEIQSAFPRAHLLPVIGNNDGACGDYESTPHGAFLAHMAAAWAGSIGISDPKGFIAQFSTGGYYSVPLPVDDAQAIVLNDVLWSPKYTNACGNAHDDPGADEVRWLQTTQKALAPGTPVWIIAHIPPGVDVYSTVHAHAAAALPLPIVIPFLTDPDNAAFIAALDTGNTVMALTGHTHMDSFRVIGPDPSSPRVPMLVVPSVSPIFGNAPAFTVLRVDPVSAQVGDSQVFMLSKIKDAWNWHREYDFDSVYGRGTIDALHLWHAQQTIFGDERVRRRFEEFYQTGGGTAPMSDDSWRPYWCANVALTVTQYVACAMPQIQHDLPPQPTAPPPPTPTPSPATSPSA